MGYPCPDLGWGTPPPARLGMGYPFPRPEILRWGTPSSASVDRYTDRCQNITFPHTTYAGGNKKVLLHKCKRHTAHHIEVLAVLLSNGGGGTLSSSGWGYPIPGGVPHTVPAGGYPIPGPGGWYPIQYWLGGVPHPRWGTPYSPGWGVPHPRSRWLVPHPVLAGGTLPSPGQRGTPSSPCWWVPPVSWMGYSPIWTWHGLPPHQLDGVRPPGPGMGYQPPGPGMGYPHQLNGVPPPGPGIG